MGPSLIGLDFKSAPPEIRQRFHLSSSKVEEIYRTFAKPVIVLSTCNRTEIYLWDQAARETIWQTLQTIFPDKEIPLGCFYEKHGREAVQHLMELAVGLHSMLLGESEILGQIETAYRIASENSAMMGDLGEVFRETLKAARKIRERSRIGAHSTSQTSLAVKEICRSYPSQGTKVLVLGQGAMASKLARALCYQGFKVTILARRITENPIQDVNYYQWNLLIPKLQEHSVIIAATTAPHTLIREEHIPWVRGKLLLDLAFPYNIERNLARKADCTIRDLEYFRKCSEANLGKKRNAAQAAMSLCQVAALRICDKLSISGETNYLENSL